MHHKILPTHTVPHLQALQDYIKAMDSMLAHLNHIAGPEIRQHDKTLGAVHTKQVHHSKHGALHAASPFSAHHLLSAALSSVGTAIGRTQRQSQSSTSGTYSVDSQLSSGQILADLASAVARSISRDL
jgi:hypothetical protein